MRTTFLSAVLGLAAGCLAEPAAPPTGSFLEGVAGDYRHFYSPGNLGRLAAGLALAAPLANTNADAAFNDWYQGKVRSAGTDGFAAAVKPIGNWKYATPIYALITLVGRGRRQPGEARPLEEWGERCLRAILVGGPASVGLQWLTGGSRPVEGSSRWNPFRDDNGLSGHAFVGAVPFLVAARMTEHRGWKALFLLGSFFCAFSRVNDEMHYLSQAGLGWWLAYLATGSVEETDILQLLPGGVALTLRF